MSSNDNNSPNEDTRRRRGSFTTQTFNNLFGRSNTTGGTPAFPSPISTAAAQDQQRRRMSMNGVGLSATSPTQAFSGFNRRSSVSTAGSSIDENAIEDDDGPGRNNQNTGPFARRISSGAQALRSVRNSGSQGSNGRSSQYSTSSTFTVPSRGGGRGHPNQASTQPTTRTSSDFSSPPLPDEGGGFNWSEQLRYRAETSVSQSNNSALNRAAPPHDRTSSVSEMQNPPTTIPPRAPAPAPAPEKPIRVKPDAIGERMLRGEFYMD